MNQIIKKKIIINYNKLINLMKAAIEKVKGNLSSHRMTIKDVV